MEMGYHWQAAKKHHKSATSLAQYCRSNSVARVAVVECLRSP